MPRIQVLDKQVAELIAAGEVVDRPSSVIKELVENAVDAGATIITVEIRRGGVTFMRVTDNGCGIAPEEVPTAFLRHATSKVAQQDDLNSIAGCPAPWLVCAMWVAARRTTPWRKRAAPRAPPSWCGICSTTPPPG